MFTKGVRTLVPRLTHALTLPVSDVFGLNHYALSLVGGGGGRRPPGTEPRRGRPWRPAGLTKENDDANERIRIKANKANKAIYLENQRPPGRRPARPGDRFGALFPLHS